MGQKLADFTRSKLGGFVYTGALMAVPLAIGAGAYSELGTDYNRAATPESHAATEAYLEENASLHTLHKETHSTLSALQEASSRQDTPEAVIAFQQKKSQVSEAFTDDLVDFATRVLNDTRLTESDYDRIEDAFTLDRSNYTDLNLPNVAPMLDEARAFATATDPEEKAYQMRDYMMDNPYRGHFNNGFILFATLLMSAGAFTSTAQRGRKILADKLAKRKKPGYSPH